MRGRLLDLWRKTFAHSRWPILNRFLPISLLSFRKSDILKTNLFDYQHIVTIRQGMHFA